MREKELIIATWQKQKQLKTKIRWNFYIAAHEVISHSESNGPKFGYAITVKTKGKWYQQHSIFGTPKQNTKSRCQTLKNSIKRKHTQIITARQRRKRNFTFVTSFRLKSNRKIWMFKLLPNEVKIELSYDFSIVHSSAVAPSISEWVHFFFSLCLICSSQFGATSLKHMRLVHLVSLIRRHFVAMLISFVHFWFDFGIQFQFAKSKQPSTFSECAIFYFN